jgi:hypothetical protein
MLHMFKVLEKGAVADEQHHIRLRQDDGVV